MPANLERNGVLFISPKYPRVSEFSALNVNPSSRVAPDVARSHTRPRAGRDVHILFYVRARHRFHSQTPRIARDVLKRHREGCKTM